MTDDDNEQALRASEERLQRALDATGLCLWDFDVPSGNIYLSESWSRLLGGPSRATRTTFAALSELVPHEQRARLFEIVIETVKGVRGEYRVEHEVRRPDGSRFWNLSEGRVTAHDADGRALRMVGTSRDITAAKHAEQQRLELEAQLRESQKMEAIGTLASGIAHDFNNILGAILGNAALASDDIGPDHAAQQGLRQIRKSALRARTLVHQILSFARKQPQELVKQPLRPLIEETLALLRATLPAGIEVETRLGDATLPVLADSTQMQQVLLNLGTNAWHALAGSGRIVVGAEAVELDADRPAVGGGASHAMAALPAGRYARIWVEDDGCGIDAALRSRIFEPFFTTKPAGQGTGLGLSVAQGIVLAHRGVLGVDSEPGKGSTFSIYLPLADAAAEPPATDWGSLASRGVRGDGQHVLYVDDDEVMGLLVDRLLQRLGYRATCVSDPLHAVSAVRERPDAFDLVVSDFNMPNLSGLELARQVAQARVDLPVVISSGHLSEEQRAALSAAGVHGIVRKERTLEDLGDVVARALSA